MFFSAQALHIHHPLIISNFSEDVIAKIKGLDRKIPGREILSDDEDDNNSGCQFRIVILITPGCFYARFLGGNLRQIAYRPF